ncbi:MAG TPA: hypothetical protein VF463_02560 [Sphingobium sp.]
MQMFKRKVLYLGGFDPRGARFYHALCAEQVKRLDNPPSVSTRRRIDGDVRWEVTAHDGSFQTSHEFLVWDDLVRRHWVKGPKALIVNTLRAYANFSRLIDWRAARVVPRGSKITLFYPGASMFLLPILVTLLLGALLAIVLPVVIALPVAMAIAIALTPPVMQRLHSKWLLRFIIFNDLVAREATDPALATRLSRFVDRVEAALDEEEWDEVLFVTHSNGSILAMPVMADLLDRRAGQLPGHFTLVTLGSTIQLVALRRDAAAFRAVLKRVAAWRFRWLDIGSLTDGACIPLVDPCNGTGVERPPGIVQFSPRWFRYSDPAAYARRRFDKYDIHFDYLRRLDKPSALDYVGITCGGRPLPASMAAFQAENAPESGNEQGGSAHV